MKLVYFVSMFIVSSYGAVEFSERPRNFSIELLHHTQLQTNGHVVISPFGIWTLMVGVALGASGNSYKELRRSFRLPKNSKTLINGYRELMTVISSKTAGVEITSSNFLFIDDDFTINPEFRDVIVPQFGASVTVLDFDDKKSAARIANSFIESSGAKVSNVLKSDDFAESRMILTNAINFKGLWSLPFNISETNVEPFYNEDGNVIGKVNMMYQRAQVPYSNIQSLNAFVLELPYGTEKKYSMLILLPYNNVKVADMYKNLAKTTLKDIFKKIENDIREYDLEDIDIKIPRFKISTNVILNKPLNDMGVYEIFDPNFARFEKITQEKIFVSAIVHKANIEVTESGTVASASTSANFADRISTPLFQANKPFVYFVVEKSTTTVIFGGIYSKPTIY